MAAEGGRLSGVNGGGWPAISPENGGRKVKAEEREEEGKKRA